ncbi:MAG TPA: DegQ family serine endoprotease [Dissulfurispiraceae bacterium]
MSHINSKSMFVTEGARPLKPAKLIAMFCSLLLLLCIALPLQARAELSDKEAAEVLSRFGEAMARVSERVKAAVVNISTTKTVKTQTNPLLNDPFFRRFFGENAQMPQKRKVHNLGSGFIATSDGYILTNNHVIDGADDILVKLSDDREYKGKVIGIDSRTDVAVIKIAEKDLPSIPWGDSDKIRVGEMVLAIGNPYGLSQTITMGIISALGRTGMGITDYEDFIQTDAAINPGNSGGPLVNVKGEVIGINTAIFSTSGGYQGLGFAIPANMVKNIMDSIVNQGKVVRGWLGVQIQPLTAELAKQFNLKNEIGVLLVETVEGGPADKAGLKHGDVITEYDGKKITDPFHFKNMVAMTKPGAAVPIKLVRDGIQLSAKVTIGELPIEPQMITTAEYANVLKGVSVQELTEDILRKANITKKIQGVVVSGIEEDSPALGILAKGDIITEVNRKAVADVKEYSSIVSTVGKGQDVLLLIVRGGVSQYITIVGTK